MHTMTFDLVIPEWANYVAQNGDGAWCAFTHLPCFSGVTDTWWRISGAMCFLGIGPRPEDWRKEVYQVIRE